MLFHEGDIVLVENTEGWEPKALVEATVIRCMEDKRGDPCCVLESPDSALYGLTSRTGREDRAWYMGFHVLKTATEIPDPERAVGFVKVTRTVR
jgi:hypothetical protein